MVVRALPAAGGDRDDERIGASRSRADIAAFFAGARVAPYVAGGRFTPTGETLRQIQDRVLPGVADSVRVALYESTAGWVDLRVAGGYKLTEALTLRAGVGNLAGRSYRVHGSGADAPGRGAETGGGHAGFAQVPLLHESGLPRDQGGLQDGVRPDPWGGATRRGPAES